MNQLPSCLVGRCWEVALCLLGQHEQDTFMVDPSREKLKKRSLCSTDGVLILLLGPYQAVGLARHGLASRGATQDYNGPS